jgi:cytochrome P450
MKLVQEQQLDTTSNYSPMSALHAYMAARDENGLGLSHTEVVDNAVQLFFAGVETSAAVMHNLLHDLAANPQASKLAMLMHVL